MIENITNRNRNRRVNDIQKGELIYPIRKTLRVHSVHGNVTQHLRVIQKFSAKANEMLLGLICSYSCHKQNLVNSAIVHSYLSTN